MREIPRPGVAEPSGAPKVLGKYRCDDRLAGDSWLEVHRGRLQGLAGFDRLFAIVSLAPGAMVRRAQAAENLLRSARQAATLQDPRIAAISDSGLAPGTAFVASELVHGVSLRALMAHLHGGGPKPQNLDLILALVGAEIAGALAVAHDRLTPIAHGALAPSAVMVTPQGGVKLLGFGLAASVLTPAELAAHPSRGPYAAPELAQGGAISPQADMFALGALIAAVATGHPGSGADRGRALQTIWPTLAPMVSALTEATAGHRPHAADAEVGFQELGRRSRGVDVRAELGALVRAALQAAVQAQPGAPEAHPPIAEASREMFNDEPTAILNVGGDNKANPLAHLLRDMRATPPHVPAVPQPMSTGFEHDSQTVMTSASNLPIPASRPPQEVILPPGPLRDTSPVAMPAAEVEGAPTNELSDVTTDEISASLNPPLQAMAADLGRKAPAMTPTGWQPGGDLEGSDMLPSELPGSLGGIEIRPRRRTGRALALAITGGALAVGAVTGLIVLRQQQAAAPVAALPAEPAPNAASASAQPPETSGPVIQPLTKEAAANPTAAKPEAAPAFAAKEPAKEPVKETVKAAPPAPASRPTAVAGRAAANRGAASGARPATATGPTSPETAATILAAAAPAEGVATGTAPATPPPPAPEPAAAPAAAPPAGDPAPRPAAAGRPAEIEIRTVPPGATAWLAGKARGTTPVTLAVPPDATELRLVRPGFESKVIPLDANTPRLVEQELVSTRAPLWGEAQLSIECKDKGKMPVLVDGREIGLLCPTGFIGLPLGPHEVGVLDPATGQKHVQNVTLTKGQKRVKISTSSR